MTPQPAPRPRAVSARARTREDRGGDPLDGLVNLFDLGIVLSVAFLLAALASIDLGPTALKAKTPQQPASDRAPSDAVVAERDERTRQIELRPGQRVVGRGERLGTVYRLRDGRTVIVRGARRP